MNIQQGNPSLTSFRKNQSGYTLLEIIFASAILSLSASLLLSVSYSLRNFEHNERQQNEIERQSTLALDYMARDTKSAAAIEGDFSSDSYHPNILGTNGFENASLVVFLCVRSLIAKLTPPLNHL